MSRVARFRLEQQTKTGGKYTKLPEIIPMGQMIYQVVLNYSKWPKNMCTNISHSKALQNIPNSGFRAYKYTIWQPCEREVASILRGLFTRDTNFVSCDSKFCVVRLNLVLHDTKFVQHKLKGF
jgi:hypothetical protein